MDVETSAKAQTERLHAQESSQVRERPQRSWNLPDYKRPKQPTIHENLFLLGAPIRLLKARAAEGLGKLEKRQEKLKCRFSGKLGKQKSSAEVGL